MTACTLGLFILAAVFVYVLFMNWLAGRRYRKPRAIGYKPRPGHNPQPTGTKPSPPPNPPLIIGGYQPRHGCKFGEPPGDE